MPNQQRLLFVSHEMTLSGAPIQLAYLVQWLHACGWKVTVVAPEAGPLADKLPRIEIVYESQLLIDPAYGALLRLIPKFDAVIANTIATWEAVQAAHLEKVPVIWYIHETEVGRQLMQLVHMMEPSLELADAVVTPTQATARTYREFRTKPINVIPYGVPKVVALPKAQKGRLRFVNIGTLEPRKGQDVLLQALQRLAPEVMSRASFQLAGRPLEKTFYGEIRKQCESLPNVTMLGSLRHEEAMQLLAEADVLICPSRDETMPIVLLEAMSLARPIISTEVGGITEWLSNGDNALVVPAQDAAALGHAIERMIGDNELRTRLGAAARQTFEKYFTLDRYGEQFAALIKDVLSRAAK